MELRDSARSPEIARRGPRRGGWVGSEGAEVASAVDRSVGAQEVACEPSGLHLPCVVEPGLNILVLLPSQTVTPLSPGRVGRARGRRVCGECAGCLWARERYAMSALRLFHNIEVGR